VKVVVVEGDVVKVVVTKVCTVTRAIVRIAHTRRAAPVFYSPSGSAVASACNGPRNRVPVGIT
jgi:hypothetical protein